MTPRSRTQPCGELQARQRLARARTFLEVAELTADETDPALEYGSVAASIAILAGKRAADHLHHLIELKDSAHYGYLSVTAPDLKRSLRQAKRLVEFADDIVAN